MPGAHREPESKARRNITGHPALTVPCGFTTERLPVGLQVIGRYYREADVLRVAAAYESITPWRARRPEV